MRKSMADIPSGAVYAPSDEVDFVIVGAGAAGGVMARELSQHGFRVVVLEQGPYLRAADFRHDELAVAQLAALTNDLHTQPNTFRGFVTSGRGQPTMTIQALAFRAADHAGRMAKGASLS